MIRFGYRTAQTFNLTQRDICNALAEQIRQEWKHNGKADQLGKILLKMKRLTPEQLSTILGRILMEPNIDWGQETNFAKMLNIEKAAKQAIGEYIGKRISQRPKGESIFLGNSSTVYYAFRGMVKHRADVHVLTIHAAILTVYPSLKSKIRSVSSIWKGRVDLDDGLIEPPDLNDPKTKSELDFLDAKVPHALISATGFDCNYGPMASNATAREVSRRALQSQTHTCILIDHSKILHGTDKSEPSLLFGEKEWREIRNRKDVEIVVNCHPQMPNEQANFSIETRERYAIENIMSQQKTSSRIVDQVLAYQDSVFKLRDIITEVPIMESYPIKATTTTKI